jgi:sodium-dependent dicarboxylate transporter 2/3/5
MHPDNWKRTAGIAGGLILFATLFVWKPASLSNDAMKVLAVAALMITWWVTEAMPMPAVALLPLILFPLLGIASIKQTASSYGDSIIFLFLGGFMLGLAIEKWNLHKRIALSIVKLTGSSGDRIILGFILATGFISMWLSNTATTMMMFPIASSVIVVIGSAVNGQAKSANFSLALMLSIAYASNFGGIATIIGTPPNVAFAAFIKQRYDYTIQFLDWMMICLPIALLLLFSLYVVLTKILYRNHIRSDDKTQTLVADQLHALGPMTVQEKRVMVIFVCTAMLWITKDLINLTGFIELDDTMIALIGSTALFLCPSGHEGGRLLDWSDTSRMAWGILLLFGGGIALAAALQEAGLIEKLGQAVSGIAGTNVLLMVFAVTVVSLFVSEVMSNIAQVIVFSPVVAGIAEATGFHPLMLGIAMTLAASCASMMPMGTPPNAIVFGSGQIKFTQMVRAGFVMNLVAIVLITLFCYVVVPLVIPAAELLKK